MAAAPVRLGEAAKRRSWLVALWASWLFPAQCECARWFNVGGGGAVVEVAGLVVGKLERRLAEEEWGCFGALVRWPQSGVCFGGALRTTGETFGANLSELERTCVFAVAAAAAAGKVREREERRTFVVVRCLRDRRSAPVRGIERALCCVCEFAFWLVRWLESSLSLVGRLQRRSLVGRSGLPVSVFLKRQRQPVVVAVRCGERVVRQPASQRANLVLSQPSPCASNSRRSAFVEGDPASCSLLFGCCCRRCCCC